MTDIEWMVAALVRAISILALDPDGQVRWLQSIVPYHQPDDELNDVSELADNFEDWWLTVPTIVAADAITPDAAAAVTGLKDQLELMSGSGNEQLWTIRALHTTPEWAHVRQLARSALDAIQPEGK